MTPCFARSVGFLPVFFPPEGCFGHAPVHAHPRPVESLPVVVGEQTAFPHFQKDAGLYPLLETVVGGGTGAKAGGIQSFPLAAGAEDEKDGLHANPVGRSRLPAAEAVGIGMFGDQNSNAFPQVIGDGPLIDSMRLVHVATSVDRSCS